METQKKDKSEWSEFISLIMEHYRLILLIVALSCAAAVVITFFIPKEYTSSAVIFPTDTNSLDDVLHNPQFGYDVEADRLIQLLQSRQVRDSIVRKFDLVSYFDIDWTDPALDYKLKTKYEKYIKFEKTIYMSVIIDARTRNPELSAKIANEIISQVGKLRERLLKQNVYLAQASLQKEYYSLKHDLDSLGNIVNQVTGERKSVRQYVQADRYISLIIDKEQMSNYESGKALQLMVDQYNAKLSWFYDVQNRLKNANLMSQRPLPSVYIIESAVPSFKKTYPKYSTNLLLAFAGSILFITLLLWFIEKLKGFRANLTDK